MLAVAAACTALTALGACFSPQGGEPWKVIANRILAVFAIWVTALLTIPYQRVLKRLRQIDQIDEVGKAEHQLRLVVEASPAGMIIVDASGQIVFTNHQAEAIFGYASGELTGLSLDVLIPADLRDVHAAHFRKFMESPTLRRIGAGRDLSAERRDGSIFPVEVGLSPITSGGDMFVLTTIVDITERKQLEELVEVDEQFRAARDIQQMLFPADAPSIEGFDIAGAAYPAESTGGDYYDYIPLNDGTLGIVIGDVCGHGFGPALLMAELRAYLRSLSHDYSDVAEIVTRANRLMSRDTRGEHFVTLFFAKVDPAGRSFHYASGGQGCFHIGANGDTTHVSAAGTVLGVLPDALMPAGPPVAVQRGDVLLLMTDGIPETMSPAGEMFGNERAVNIVREHRDRSSRDMIDALYHATCTFADGGDQKDDITAVVIKVLD